MVLCTLNAKYIHASLGLRYLLANMGPLRPHTVLREFTTMRKVQEMAQELLAVFGDSLPGQAQVLGLGVYIWNVVQTTALVRELRVLRPAIKIVLGGPEVSHETDQQEIVQLADHVITGWGDISFAALCQALVHGPRPLMKVIAGEQPPLAQIALPYSEYNQDDLAHRTIYVEASRGCPFKCEFCLSSLDKTAWAFDADRFLAALADLYERGARRFKFVDRTFNLKIDASLRILQFFLDRLHPAEGAAAAAGPELFLHFEVIPDHLPQRLKDMIVRFPPGVLQFEIGIQSFNVEVQQRISRRQDNAQTEQNLRWLVGQSHAHLHTDLIFGLPGESLQSFAEGFDRLLSLQPHEIQLGMLKRLRGTPIARHTVAHGMVYEPSPPYTVRESADVSAQDMLRVARFARYWELFANSGRFQSTLALLIGRYPDGGLVAEDSGSAFFAFLAFSDWLWLRTGQVHLFSQEHLVDYADEYLRTHRRIAAERVREALLADYLHSGARARPAALRQLLMQRSTPVRPRGSALTARQHTHRGATLV